VTETVTVSDSRVATVDVTSSTVSKVVSNSFPAEYGKNAGAARISTPRLREYFPETLVWQPLLETDARGRTRMDFKLADNITTWKMAVIGSTQNGEVGIVEKEIRAFQPFFVEHEPPRVLTEGDEIQLPVVLRNYLDKSQAVELEIKPESWFALLGPGNKRAEVASNDSSRETFDFRAVASVRDGKQRITAKGSEASDAIEKPVSVHPDGEERAVTVSQLLEDTTTLPLNIPAELIKGSLRAELKIYPNLLSHVAESVEGILERPHGCGEQTISSTYPNLMILRFNKNLGKDSLITAKARKYLGEGYRRLLNYRADSGGFSYWGGDESADFALTAYALSFLNDAREFLEVDEAVINGARDFLIKEQRPDGSWSSPSRYSATPGTPRENLTITSYLARILASVDARSEAGRTAKSSPGQQGA
ncbi:MAG TPA: alpha-2-macroglobulin family protein, partial [Pyrinomonadaceae bacterium]|nr:alpha-2-macroglobulin family protein [Pyrinomonadaceae bacterium]